ncbi:hypothetical protein N7535_004165 [Penicillium sp. DV-2018c]|nr:hypothetical protein N7535_004165 [Penicillium sp. DV-2018c]
MQSFTFLILTFLSINVPVLASSRAWQPALVDKPGLNRRWATIPSQSSTGKTEPWPDRKITYCLDDESFGDGKDKDKNKKKMRKAIHNAHKLWKQSGLSDDFKISEGADEFCKDNGNRKQFLLVPVHDPRLSEKSTNDGATTTLSFRTDIGMLDTVPNIAHELGHAWGLHHEHQNAYFWSSDVVAGQDGTVFGPANNGNWKCEHLKDYADFADGKYVGGVGTQWGRVYSREELCNSYTLASTVQFSAAEYLPFLAGSIDVEISSAAGVGSVDWDSIMIYPSGAGGIEGAVALDDDGDKRLSILERPPDNGGELRKREGVAPESPRTRYPAREISGE